MSARVQVPRSWRMYERKTTGGFGHLSVMGRLDRQEASTLCKQVRFLYDALNTTRCAAWPVFLLV